MKQLCCVFGFLLLMAFSGSGLKTNFLNASLDDIEQKASQIDKPYFVNYGTNWCMPCKKMDIEVFNHKGVSQYLNKNFLALKADAESEEWQYEAMMNSVRGYPTIIFYTPAGKEMGRIEGYCSANVFLRQAKKYGSLLNASGLGLTEFR